jgi:hypothetical protein
VKTKFVPSVRFRSLPLTALALFGLVALPSLALAVPAVTGTKAAAFPPNNDSSARPGDTITYTIGIGNGAAATDATGVQLADTVDPNSTFVNNSAKVSANAIAHQYNAAGNTQLIVNVANGLRNGVTDIDGVTPNTSLVVTAGTFATSAGGSVTIAADGSFTYTPEVGDQNLNDTFSYTVTDGDGLASTGLVTIALGARVWYVDSTYAGANGTENGSNTRPFNSLADISGATGPDAVGDFIFIVERAGDYDGNLTLLNNQQLYGSGASLTVNTVVINTAGANTTLVTTAASTNSITLGGGTGNTVTGFTIGNTTGSKIAGTSFGTLTISNVTMLGSGQALNLTTGTVNGTIDSLTSTSSGTNSVALTTVAGTLTITTGAMSGATGAEFLMSGSNGTVSYGGTITNTAGRSVDIQTKSGGTVTFTGAINDTGAGIFLDNNDQSAGNATIIFRGGLNLATTTSAAFTATNGGIVNVCNTNDCASGSAVVNTITTTTGVALNVANTSIGSSGLKFQKISAGTGAAGPANGIILNNTGSTAGLTITANGGTCSTAANCTGGAIQDTSGAGISLTNTQKVVIDRMFIQDTGQSGVGGTQVVDFTFTNSRIDNSGTSYPSNADNDSNIGFGFQGAVTENNLSGVVVITGNTLTNATEHGIDIQNFAGTISNATITGNSITSSTSSGTSHGSGIRLLGFGHAGGTSNITKATIASNSIFNFPGGAGITAQYGNNSAGPAGAWGTVGSGTNRIFIQNNIIQGQSAANPMNTNAILMTLTGKGQANWLADSNGTVAQPIANIGGAEIGVTLRGVNPIANCDITNNRIVGITNVAAQGIAFAADFLTATTDAPQLFGTIIGNNISGQDGQAIQVLATPGSSAHIDVAVKNNITTAPNCGGCNRFGITAEVGSSSANTTGAPSMCLDMSGNTAAGSGVNTGIGIRKKTAAYVFNIEGFAGGGDPTVYLNGLNPAGGGVIMISQTTGFGNCSTAPLLAAPGGIEKAPATAVPNVKTSAPSRTQVDETPSLPVIPRSVRNEAKVTVAPAATSSGVISQSDLDRAVTAAYDRWSSTGLSGEQLAFLRKLKFEVADLPSIYLGEAAGDRIRVDNNAGGNGWFMDANGASESVFAQKTSATRHYTNPASDAAGRIDLLTTIMHEMGHAIGLPDSYSEKDRDSLMYGFLTKGERRLPSKGQAMGAIPGSVTGSHFLNLPVTIGTLNPGTTVTVKFDATVNGGGFCGNITNTANISGSNFTTVNTNTTTVPVHFPPSLFSAQTPPSTATVGFAYAGYTFVANGCPAPTYALAPGSGPLPGGFSLSAAGALTASNPTTAGTFSNIIVRATNTAGVFDTTPFTITVAPAITFDTNSPLAPWTKDKSGYSQTIMTSGGTGAKTFTVSAGSLPNGLSLDTNTGAITGTPTVAGTFNFTIKATDSLGANTSKAYQIVINAAIVVTPATLPNGQVGVAYSQTVGATGGTGAKTFSVTSGALPTPLTLNSSSGVISGTPDTPGTYMFTITATDTVSATGSQAYTVVIKQATSTSLISSSNPSSNGAAVTFTATVSPVGAPPGTPTGTATFFDGASPITCTEGGTARPLNGSSQATCTTSSLTVAGSPHSITAQYSGDGNYLASTSNTVSQTIINCTTPATVTNLNDAGAGSLRDALTQVCDGGTINFQAGLTGTITLTTGKLLVNKNVTITGPGASVITVSGNNVTRVFEVVPAKTVAISGLTIANGLATGAFPANEGGGIFNDHSALTVANCVLSGNVASDSGGGIFNSGFGSGSSSTVVKSCTFANNSAANGGALYNYGDTGAATVDVINSTFTNNSALGTGGAISNFGSAATGNATLRIVNTTISGNRSNTDGGGIYNTNNASAATASTTLTNVTITGNRADNDTNASGTGGGIRAVDGTVTLKNTIVSGNFKGGSPSTTADDVAGSINADFSLFGNTTGATITGANNQLNVDPLLGVLANNGGPTQTHLPGATSLAINNGSNALLPADTFDLDNDANVAETLPVDQRGPGFPRVVNTTVDIGAVEVNYIITATAGTPQSATADTAFATNLKATVSESGVPISGVSVTFTAPASGPSGTFADTGTNVSNPIVTNGSGEATAPVFTANSTAGGPYTVFAAAPGYNSASFQLTNDPPPPSPTPTATATATATATSTPTPTATATATSTPTATATSTPTATATSTPTATATATATSTPTATATATATASPTPTSTATATATATATPTSTPTATATATPTATATSTPTATATATPTATATATPTSTPTATATATATPTATATATATPTATPTATATATATPTATATATPATTPTATATATPTATPAASATATATPTATPAASATASATPTATPSATPRSGGGTLALNISTRLRVDIGDKVMIGGFIIQGNQPKAVLLRGLGPSLTNFGVAADAVLMDPVLELHGPGGSLITSNDNWVDSPQRSQIEGTSFQPTDDHEAVILATLPPGAYTGILKGVGQTAGVGLIEVYDRNELADSDLANISTRGFVENGSNVMIGGFTLGGSSDPTRIAVRALGPSLAGFGLSNVMADPTLELHNANGTIMVSNDDWESDPVSAAELLATGLAPADPKESGIFASLAPPGQFTAIVAGKNGGIGIAIVEIYNLK